MHPTIVRHPLAHSLALALVLLPFPALAGDFTGGSHTVNPGDPVEAWTVRGGGQLIVTDGAETQEIRGFDSALAITGALVSNSGTSYALDLSHSDAVIDRTTIRSVDGYGIYLRRSGGAGSSLALSNSVLEAKDTGVLVGIDGAANISNSRITTTAAGTPLSGAVVSQGASMSITDRSVVTGADVGFRFFLGNLVTVENGTLLLDGSSIEGVSGSAIHVQAGATGSLTTEANVLVRNGAQLQGGNGDLLTVEQGSYGDFLPTANLTVETTTLAGNVTAKDGASANVTLRDGGRINGIFNAVDRATIENRGYWQLAGDSSVNTLDLQSGGAVELGDGSTFHTLTVSGNYTGSGGTLLFNTVLAGDDAATDRLVIGGDSIGQTNVRVNNVGGGGAQTGQGIELIRVAGASNGQFDLIGRAVGGRYDYFLFKGPSDGNWYLRSELPTSPDPCDLDPTLPQCGGDPGNPVDPVDPGTPVDPVAPPEPVLRPEGGAYLANLQAAQSMFRVGYHDRQAGQNSGRGWARVDGSRTSFGAISRQLDIHGNSQALSIGADILRNDSGSALGLMLSTGNATSTSTNALTGYFARGKVRGESLGVYGTWRPPHDADPYAGFYVDGSLQRAQFRNRVEGVELATERYDSHAWQGAVESGYAFRVGGADRSSLYLEPQLQLGYNRWNSLRHTEANGTVVTSDDSDGLYGRVGVRLSGVTRWGNGSADVQPYIAANWLHTRAESQVRMDDERIDARIPRSRGEFSAGASLRFANGFGAWGGLLQQRASGYIRTSAQLGLSYNW